MPARNEDFRDIAQQSKSRFRLWFPTAEMHGVGMNQRGKKEVNK